MATAEKNQPEASCKQHADGFDSSVIREFIELASPSYSTLLHHRSEQRNSMPANIVRLNRQQMEVMQHSEKVVPNDPSRREAARARIVPPKAFSF